MIRPTSQCDSARQQPVSPAVVRRRPLARCPRELRLAALALTLASTALFALAAPTARADARRGEGPCPGGRPTTGDLGFDLVQCVGGACRLFADAEEGGYLHELSSEPRLREFRRGGPVDGVLEEGDTLVAVDGLLITTRAGGRRLANLTPGEAVELRIRREGREQAVRVTPVEGCGPRRLVVGSDSAKPARGKRRGG